MKKILFAFLALLVVSAVGAAAYVKFAIPKVALFSDIQVDVSPIRIERGEYLANHVTLCMDCHSNRDWSKFSGPMVPGTLGKGGEYFDENLGMPGQFYSKNITPFHLKDWSDAELFRVITTGENKDGDAIFPLMPYLYYGKMDKEDIFDIIAYIRSLSPIANTPPERSLNFPMNFIINTIPEEARFTIKPAKNDTIRYGAYLTNASACVECHTQVKQGVIIPELAFSGGREFIGVNGSSVSANITPDMETGIGKWSAKDFVERFKSYQNIDSLPQLDKNDINTVMPWNMLAGMEESDLIAIYKYLHTLKPIHNTVVHFKSSSIAHK